MSKQALGQKIKELRLAKKLTQREVVGDFITRNMLSQIESGTATPSVRTLAYLAKVLEVPVSTLLESEETQGVAADLAEAKRLYRQGKLKPCMAALSRVEEEFADEANALKAKASLKLAQEALLAGDFDQVRGHAGNAIAFNDDTIYGSQSIKAEALLCLNEVTNEGWDYFMQYQSALQSSFLSAHSSLINAEMYLNEGNFDQAQIVLKSLEGGGYSESIDMGRIKLLQGRVAMGRGKWDEALCLFREADECWADLPRHALRPSLYQNMEQCAIELGDYKQAHYFATMRLALATGEAPPCEPQEEVSKVPNHRVIR